jgi:hypothetical protein
MSTPNNNIVNSSFIDKFEGSFEKEELGVTVIPNKSINDIHNMEALGFYIYLLGRPKKWQPNVKQLKAHFECGEDKVYRVLNYLIAEGFISKTVQREKGRFVSHHYKVHIRRDVSPLREKPDVVKPDVENTDTYKTKNIKNKEEKNSVVCSVDSNDLDRSAAHPQFFSDYKKQELEALDQELTHSNKATLEYAAITDEKNIELFNQRFEGLDITIEELFKDCQEYYAQTAKWVGSQRFNKWIRNERLENYSKSVTLKSEIDNRIKAQERISLERAKIELENNHNKQEDAKSYREIKKQLPRGFIKNMIYGVRNG